MDDNTNFVVARVNSKDQTRMRPSRQELNTLKKSTTHKEPVDTKKTEQQKQDV